MLEKINTVFNRHIILFLACAVVLHFGMDRKKMAIKTLNYYNTSPQELAQCAKGPAPCPGHTLREARRYYESLTVLMPASPLPYLTLSYIYAQLGNNAQALNYANKAKDIGLTFYGTHYNSGVLLWQLKLWKRAAEELELALIELTAPSHQIPAMIIEPRANPFYFDKKTIDSHTPLISRLSAYTEAVLLLTFIYENLGDFKAMAETATKGEQLPTLYKEKFRHLKEIAADKQTKHNTNYRKTDISLGRKDLSPKLYCVIPLLLNQK